MLMSRANECRKQWMRLQRLGLELGMKLAAQEPGMVGDFANLDVHRVRSLARDSESARGEDLLIFAVELVAMAVALADLGSPVGFARETAFRKQARISAESHGPAQLIHAFQLAQLVDDTVRSGRIELRRICVLEPANVAREFDDRRLHAEADSEIRNLLLARVTDGRYHAFHATFAEPAGYQDSVEFFQIRRTFRPVHVLRLDPMNIYFEPVGDPAVEKGFLQALVGILVLHV